MQNSKKRESIYMVTLMTVMLLHMGAFGMSSALNEIQKSFPDYSAAAVQMIISASTVFQLIITFFTAKCVKLFSERGTVLIGLIAILAGSVCGFFVHKNIVVLCVWMAIIGCGVGLAPAVSTTIAYKILSEENINRLLGLRTCMVNTGGFILVFAGGLLTEFGWHFNFLVYFLAVIPLILCLIFLPKDTKIDASVERTSEDEDSGVGESSFFKLPGKVYYYVVIALLGNMLYSVFMMNISMYVSDLGITSSLTVGVINGAFMLGGMVYALLFTKFNQVLGEWMIPIAFADMLVGFIICCVLKSVPSLMIGGFIIGGSVPMIMPRSTVSIAECVNKQNMVRSMSLLLSFAPGVAGLLTPVVFTTLVEVLFGSATINRFISAIVVLAVAIIVFTITTKVATGKKSSATL